MTGILKFDTWDNSYKSIVTSNKSRWILTGLFRWAKCGWNQCSSLDCYAILSPNNRPTRDAPYGLLCETWRYSNKRA